jgi:DNA-binding IscR family transcriptional regulator
LWAKLNDHIFGYLRAVTLAELVRNHQSASNVTVIRVTERQPGASPTVAA